MTDLRSGPDLRTVGALFRARYPELVRLADLLGADDPEDIAQEAFSRLLRRQRSLRDQEAGLAYVRACVCNLTRNRHRHLRVSAGTPRPAGRRPRPSRPSCIGKPMPG